MQLLNGSAFGKHPPTCTSNVSYEYEFEGQLHHSGSRLKRGEAMIATMEKKNGPHLASAMTDVARVMSSTIASPALPSFLYR
jgi:hypothetical protein